MSQTVLVNPTILKMMDDDLDGLQMLAEWLLIESTYPNGAGRPAYMGRVCGAKKTGLQRRLSGAKVTISVSGDETVVSMEGNGAKKETFVSLDEIRRQLAIQGKKVELPPVKGEPEKPRLAFVVANNEEKVEPMDEDFRRLLPIIKEHTLVLSLINSIRKKEEKLFAQQRIAKYMRDFPELNIAPDETLLASLMMSELSMYRLQQEIAKGGAVTAAQVEKTQSTWFDAANALGVTRSQRLKQGDSVGTSIADLSAKYDELQRQALRQFESDMQEEVPMLEKASERKLRELAPGTAEQVLLDQFGIKADVRRDEFTVEEEDASA